MRYYLIVLFSLCSVLSANAQQTVSKYDFDTIDSSIKCELSRVSRLYGPQRAGSPIMKVSLELTGTQTTTKKVSVNFFGTASYETTRKGLEASTWTRNINEKNRVNCGKSFVVDLGLYDCMLRRKANFFEGRTITCGDTTSASTQAGVGVKFVWFIEAKLDGDVVIKREYEWKLKAPPT